MITLGNDYARKIRKAEQLTLMTGYPALYGQPVEERHLWLCRTQGHAHYEVDGVDAGQCPRCGEVFAPANHSDAR